jgi:CBS domain-containing protein
MSQFDVSLDEYFDKLHLRPLRQIDQNDDAWVAAGYLVTSLNSFSDGLAVMDGKDPIGTLGGKIFITNLMKNPTHSFFKETKSKSIMQTGLSVLQSKTKLSEVLELWKNSKIGFSAVQKDGELYALSLRNFLLLVSEMNSAKKISDLPKKPLVTFSMDDTIEDLFQKMLKNRVRRLVLEGTKQIISDRTILNDICIDMNYLKYTENLLNLKANVLNTETPEIISDDLTISELAETLSKQIHPIVVYEDNIITPWDLLQAVYGEEK